MPAKILPFSEKHAIRNVLFVFEFSRPLPSQALSELRAGTALHEELKKLLPKFTEQQQVVINLGEKAAFGFPSAAPPQEISAFSFESIKPNGEPALGLNIQAGRLFLVCGDYSRWVDVFGKIDNVIRLLAVWLDKHVEVSTFALQYLDEFKVEFEGGRPQPLVELFNVDSQYIVSNFLAVTGAFHSHHGFFSEPEYSIPGRLLTNININVAEFPVFVNAQIQVTHKYVSSAHMKIANEDGLTRDLREAYEFLHQENKKVVRSLLTDKVKAMISFDSEQAGKH